MKLLLITLSIILVTVVNIIKVKRLSLFIEPYEEINTKNQLQALSISNILNLILPFRSGNIIRALYVGKKMENGVSFAIATILVEIFLDFICVSIIYIVFALIGFVQFKNILFFIIATAIIILILLFIKYLKKYVKNIIYKISSIFNKKIELKLLKTSYFTIVSLENIIYRISKIKLIFYSFLLWVTNIISCLLLDLYIGNDTYKLYDVFNFLNSSVGVSSSLVLNFKLFDKDIFYILLIYTTVSNILLFVYSFIIKNKIVDNKKVNILPITKKTDRLNSLEDYFNGVESFDFKKYLKINEDVAILENFSAGSNATTLLCSANGKTFYRKLSFGDDASKLNDQIKWIHEHEKKLKLTSIINEHYEKGICYYDMPFVNDASTCFSYVHTTPFDEAFNTIKACFNDLDKNLHSVNRRSADKDTITKYIDSKVLKNIEKIENGEYIKPLNKYDYIYINGKKYHNLSYFKKYLNKEFLSKIFENDPISDIHGDFTIENIVCIKGKKKNNYYIIDPNTGNVHDSPYLDYAKFLQSIHGGYEFLMNTKEVNYKGNKIEFIFTKSSTYNKLYDEFFKIMKDKFGEDGVLSIHFHEVIHWLRLMPYKINKNGERSLLFYAGLIMVLTEVEKMVKK